MPTDAPRRRVGDQKWRKRVVGSALTLISIGALGGGYKAAAWVHDVSEHLDVTERPGGLVDQYRATQKQDALDAEQLNRIERKVDNIGQVFFFMLSAPSEREQRAWFRDKAHELGLIPLVVDAPPPPQPKP